MYTKRIFAFAVIVVTLGCSIVHGEQSTEQSTFVTKPELFTVGGNEYPFTTEIVNTSYERYIGYYRSQGYSIENAGYPNFKRSITFVCPCSVHKSPSLFLLPEHYDAGTLNVSFVPGNVYKLYQYGAEATFSQTVFGPGAE